MKESEIPIHILAQQQLEQAKKDYKTQQLIKSWFNQSPNTLSQYFSWVGFGLFLLVLFLVIYKSDFLLVRCERFLHSNTPYRTFMVILFGVTAIFVISLLF